MTPLYLVFLYAFQQPLARGNVILTRLFSLVDDTRSQAKPNQHIFI